MPATDPHADTLSEALALHQGGSHPEAADLYLAILAEVPGHSEALHLFGLLLHQNGESGEGLARIEAALAVQPENSAYLYNHGVILQELGRDGEAAAEYRRSLALNAGNASPWVNLGNLLSDHGHFAEALDCHRNALKLQPEDSGHCLRLARDLRLIGDIEGALAHLGLVVSRNPDNEDAWSALLFTSQYQSGITRAELHRRHRAWSARLPVPSAEAPATKSKESKQSKEKGAMRIGFLSPDLGNHPVGIFVAPLLERLRTKSGVTAVCFNDRRRVDEYLVRNRAAAGEWHDVAGCSHDELEKILREANLDVLVELCGHGDGNRLPVLARKPVPLQMSWAGYVGTTGLAEIDYLISDRHHTPDKSEPDFTETLLWFPFDYIAWEPPSYAPEPGPLPMLETGYPTFGCFNSPSKLNEKTLALWGALLRHLPEARLLLKYKGMDDPAVADRVRGLLGLHGVAPHRVELLGQTNHIEHLAAFARVDVALDPMPYSGGLSTCEAIWMGVPVVTLPSDTFASRHSLSHLSNADLPDTVAKDRRDYLRIATALVSDPAALGRRRSAMRAKVAASPLCDFDAYANDFVTAIATVTGRNG